MHANDVQSSSCSLTISDEVNSTDAPSHNFVFLIMKTTAESMTAQLLPIE